MSLPARLLLPLALAASACAPVPQTRAAAPAASITVAPGARIQRLDPALDALIDVDARIEKLAEGFAWSEGPLWRRAEGYLLFSDIPRNTIYKWKEGEGLSVYLRPAGFAGANPPGRELGTNGLTLDAAGRVVVADHGNRAISRLDDSVFTRTVLADRFEGKRFNSPNDLVFHPNGDLFFTDPPYGLQRRNEDPAKELPFNGVYRLSKAGVLSVVTRDLVYPNGLALSPDARRLYVAMSDAQRPQIMVYEVAPDGATSGGRVFFDANPLVQQRLRGALDGLKVDLKGNLFATGPGGVLILSPEGKHLGSILTGDLTANCAFGDDGSTLYMTVNHQLMRVKTKTRGW